MTKIFHKMLCFVLCLSLCGCGGKKAGHFDIHATNIRMKTGTSYTFDVSGDTDGLIWYSADEQVITISPEGVLQAVAPGESTVVAQVGQNERTCIVEVSDTFSETAQVFDGDEAIVASTTTKSDTQTSLTLDISELSVAPGTKQQLTAVTEPEGDIVWKSSNTAIAKVTEAGYLTAIQEGTCEITASSHGMTEVMALTVATPAAGAKLEVGDDSWLMEVGETRSVNVNTLPDRTVFFTSDHRDVLRIDSTGATMAMKRGKAIITVNANGLTRQISVLVGRTLILDQTELSLRVGEEKTIKAKVQPKAEVKWTSSDKEIATVSDEGIVKGKKAGTCTITAKANGLTEKVAVTVKKAQQKASLKLNKSKVSLRVGKTTRVKATAKPSTKVHWKSSNRRIATVSSTGRITAKRRGTCRITATANGVTKTVKVTVTRSRTRRKSSRRRRRRRRRGRTSGSSSSGEVNSGNTASSSTT